MQIGSHTEGELSPELRQRIEEIVAKDRIILFMKGNRQMPQCGFSDAVVKALNACEAEYVTYDILMDPELRFGMKIFSEWPTFPQLYVDKELVGGCDIIIEMYQNGELEKVLAK